MLFVPKHQTQRSIKPLPALSEELDHCPAPPAERRDRIVVEGNHVGKTVQICADPECPIHHAPQQQ
jgi:hypothetical protein